MAKYHSRETILKRENAPAGGVFTAVPQIIELDLPEQLSAKIDVTCQDSPGNELEFIPGERDPGEMGVTVAYDPANAVHINLIADSEDPATNTRAWQVIFPDAGAQIYEFTAWVQGFKVDASRPDALKATFRLVLSGTVEYDASP